MMYVNSTALTVTQVWGGDVVVGPYASVWQVKGLGDADELELHNDAPQVLHGPDATDVAVPTKATALLPGVRAACSPTVECRSRSTPEALDQ